MLSEALPRRGALVDDGLSGAEGCVALGRVVFIKRVEHQPADSDQALSVVLVEEGGTVLIPGGNVPVRCELHFQQIPQIQCEKLAKYHRRLIQFGNVRATNRFKNYNLSELKLQLDLFCAIQYAHRKTHLNVTQHVLRQTLALQWRARRMLSVETRV